MIIVAIDHQDRHVDPLDKAQRGQGPASEDLPFLLDRPGRKGRWPVGRAEAIGRATVSRGGNRGHFLFGHFVSEGVAGNGGHRTDLVRRRARELHDGIAASTDAEGPDTVLVDFGALHQRINGRDPGLDRFRLPRKGILPCAGRVHHQGRESGLQRQFRGPSPVFLEDIRAAHDQHGGNGRIGSWRPEMRTEALSFANDIQNSHRGVQMGARLAIGPCAIGADFSLERRYLARKAADGVVGLCQ